MGMLPSASLGTQKNKSGGTRGLYEPIHGTALYTPEVVGTGRANPIAAILSLALMLRYSLAMPEAADTVEAAVEAVLNDGYRTADIAGPGTTTATTEALARHVADRVAQLRIK
jgi:3-isopropylmalate dehydrogenase